MSRNYRTTAPKANPYLTDGAVNSLGRERLAHWHREQIYLMRHSALLWVALLLEQAGELALAEDSTGLLKVQTVNF